MITRPIISPSAVAVAHDTTQQFTSTQTDNKEYLWEITIGKGYIDENGLYTAPGQSTYEDMALIRRVSRLDGEIFGSAVIVLTKVPRSVEVGAGGGLPSNYQSRIV